MADDAALHDRVVAAVRGAFAGVRAVQLLHEVDAWLRRSPDAPPPFACVSCARRPGEVGASSGPKPFFGAAGGWLEAGGVRWICACCERRDVCCVRAPP